MHYRNGREAHAGDRVLHLNGNWSQAGYLVALQPGASSCNANVIPINGGGTACVTVSYCLCIDDIEAAFPAAAPT